MILPLKIGVWKNLPVYKVIVAALMNGEVEVFKAFTTE